MPRRVNPIILLGLVIVLFFSSLISAIAQIGAPPAPTGGSAAAPSGGASGGSAVGLALGVRGAPHVEGAEGPNAFSCTGLLRWVGKNLGFPDLPWAPGGWYSYPQRNGAPLAGDVIILPGAAGVGLALGDGNMVMSNAVDGVVETVPLGVMGGYTTVVPPWNGSTGGNPTVGNPAANTTGDPTVGNNLPAANTTGDPAVGNNPAVTNPAGATNPVGGNSAAGINPTGTTGNLPPVN